MGPDVSEEQGQGDEGSEGGLEDPVASVRHRRPDPRGWGRATAEDRLPDSVPGQAGSAARSRGWVRARALAHGDGRGEPG